MTQEPICGLCRKPLRYGQNHELLRVAAADLTPDVLGRLQVNTTKPAGLYALCTDCVAVLKPLAQQRLASHFDCAPGDVDGHRLL